MRRAAYIGRAAVAHPQRWRPLYVSSWRRLQACNWCACNRLCMQYAVHAHATGGAIDIVLWPPRKRAICVTTCARNNNDCVIFGNHLFI
eukprot:2243154-Pyramimonas_sp.AAC.1